MEAPAFGFSFPQKAKRRSGETGKRRFLIQRQTRCLGFCRRVLAFVTGLTVYGLQRRSSGCYFGGTRIPDPSQFPPGVLLEQL
jgi:hypothetical protein